MSRFCFMGTTPVIAPMSGPMKNPKVETNSRDSNSRPYDCEANDLPYDHGHHKHLLIAKSFDSDQPACT